MNYTIVSSLPALLSCQSRWSMQAISVNSLPGIVKKDRGVLLLWSQDDNGCQPQTVRLPDGISVIQAAVGQAHGLLLGQGGQLFGFERLSPTELNASKPDHLSRTTESLAEADEKFQARHVLLRDLQETFPERRDNSQFSDAVDNQYDLSSKLENVEGMLLSWSQPQLLTSLVGRVVISVSTGVSHCGVVCQDGAVYMWGKNTEGQCGICDVPFVGKPTSLTFPREDAAQSSWNAGDINVTQLSCGESHTLALTKQGELWSWGTGPQIGQGSGVGLSPCPRIVEALRGRRVLQASSGAQHSIALVEVLTVLSSLEPDRCQRCQQLVVTMTDTDDHVLISDEHYCLGQGKIFLMPENQSTVDFVAESDGNGQGLLEPVSGEQHNSSAGGSCSQSMDEVENLLLPSSTVTLERAVSEGVKSLGDGTNQQPECRSLDGAVGAEAPTVPSTLWNRKYWSLVDMRAVRDECSRRLSLPSLLSNLAQVPSLVRRGEPHSASVSNPQGSSSDLQHVDELSLQTEVWSWGDGAVGQLGLGDLCPRWQPACVKAGGQREVVKVAAGAKHSLALTSRGQVFSWGSNDSKQLGLDKPFSAVPCPIKLGMEHVARDVAAGRFHSFVLADASSGSTDVLCFGTMGDGPGKPMEHGESVPLPQPDGLLTAVSGSGERAVGFCCLNPDPILRAMDELCRSEHLFFMRLSQLKEKLKPLLRPTVSKASRSSAVDSSVKTLGSCFGVLCNLVEQHCRSLADCLAFHLNPMDLLLLNQPEIFTSIYKQYLVALANFFAIDGLESILKTDSETTKNALQNIQEYWPQLDDVASPAQSFIKLLEFPIAHVHQYEEFIGELEIFWTKDSVKEQFFCGLHILWESLATFWTQLKTDAEKTRLFWVSCTAKMSDSLRQPNRRLVQESRCCPLLLQNAARFSIHWFILFNDMFVHVQFSSHQILPLKTLWIDATQDDIPENSFKIITPEERLVLTAPDAKGKVEWLRLLNRTLDQAFSDSTQERTDEAKDLHRQSLFTSRNVVHTFYRDPRLKRATYQGSWVCGKPHGQGKLRWPDGRQYKGSFRNGLEDGIGELRVPNRLLQKDDVYQGPWKAAKMHGQGVMHYANGDTYEGSFVDGARNGHGMQRSGSFASLSSSIYIGQWFNDRKSGYGVLDDITRGEKYMGMWLDDNRHGQGVVVSQFGLYYEGIFSMNKMAGQGILLAEDNTRFQGEFTADLALNGKGLLTLPSGDFLAGNFSGVWGGELKVSGTFRKTFPGEKEKSTTKPQWGDLAVSPKEKWKGVFAECWAMLGCDSEGRGDGERAWEAIAVCLANGWKDQEYREDISRSGSLNFDKLEVIPQRWEGDLTNERYQVIENYLSKACDTVLHPLGRLLDMLVTVYRATYVGVGANKRLLHQAVEEVKSYVRSVFQIVRFLFSELPEEGRFVTQTGSSNELPPDVKVKQQCPTTGPLVTHYGLVLPILLPRIYPPLFTIYALQHECRDELYWERVLRLNKQSDVGLLSFLGVQRMFWPIDESLLLEGRQGLSTIRDECFASAVDSLQQISTTFTPSEKLTVIQKTFEQINQSLEGVVQTGYVWSMDDLFPVFLYVVLRARIRNLGSEIHLIEDLMDPFVQHGEQGIMFTTLKACYFQIHKERLT
uniref:alsin isoform X2 n=1 Tax=Myxine glutinosa TaxID=7769 RepID=UPI0035900305